MSSARQELSPKYSAERLLVVFNFVSQLDAGETLTSATTTAAVYSGTDASPSAILSGATAVSGVEATQLTIGGVEGAIYMLSCAGVTSSGQTIVITGFLSVIGTTP